MQLGQTILTEDSVMQHSNILNQINRHCSLHELAMVYTQRCLRKSIIHQTALVSYLLPSYVQHPPLLLLRVNGQDLMEMLYV
jgi:hypothetical protein